MTQPNPVAEKAGVTFQPSCPKCGQPMWLVRLSRYDATHDLRSFECQVCEHTESNVVEFKAAG